MKKLRFLFLYALAFLPLGVNAQSDSTRQAPPNDGVYTLEECINFAIENTVSVKNAKLDRRLAEAKVGEIKAIGLPQLNASVDFNNFFKVPKAFLPGEVIGGEPGTFVAVEFQPQYSGTASASLSQLIFDGSYLLGLKAAKVYIDVTDKQVEKLKIDIAEEVSKAYYGVLINRERLRLLESNFRTLDTLLRQTEALYENGFAEEIDAKRLKVTRNNLKTEKLKLERLVDLSLSVLKFQMGMDPSEKLALSGSIRDAELGETPDAANVDPSQRLEYQMLKIQEELNILEIKNYRVGYLPRLVGFASYGSNTGTAELGDFFNFGDFWFGQGLFGVKLEIPIFDGFQKKFQIQQGKLELQKTRNDMTNFGRAVMLEAQQAQIQLQNARASMAMQKENMELAEEVYRVTQVKYREGVGSNREMLDAENDLNEAQTNYYSALYDAIVAKISLEKALGTLTYTPEN